MACSTLAYANEKRSNKVIEDLYYYHRLTVIYKGLVGNPIRLFSLDSTTISLCLSHFPWTHYRRAKDGVKVHTLLNNDTLLPEYMVMTNAKVNNDKAAKDQVLQRVPPHCILVMDRGYCDFGLFKALDAKGVVFVTRLTI